MKFFSCVKGKLVSRYGAAGVYIAARFAPEGLVFDEEAIVAIPDEEIEVHGRRYAKHVKAGDLKERSEKDFGEYVDRLAKKITAPTGAEGSEK